MVKVAVIGAGAFGTAMACVARRCGNDVLIWAREPEVAASINEYGANPHFLPGVPCTPGIRATTSLEQAVRACDFVLMAVPAQHMREIAGRLAPALRSRVPVVSCAKGIERGSGALMPEVLAQELPDAVVAVLSGPSFAREIAVDMASAVALASADPAAAACVARALSSPRFCLRITDDVAGVAVAGAMKNVVAIASGVVHGRKMGESARASVIALGMEEAWRLAAAKGARAATFLGLAGAGDFTLTGQSLQSRNTAFGLALAQGRGAAELLAERKTVTEGAQSVSAVVHLAASLGVEVPITAALDDVITRGVPLDSAISALVKRLQPSPQPGPVRLTAGSSDPGKP